MQKQLMAVGLACVLMLASCGSSAHHAADAAKHVNVDASVLANSIKTPAVDIGSVDGALSGIGPMLSDADQSINAMNSAPQTESDPSQ